MKKALNTLDAIDKWLTGMSKLRSNTNNSNKNKNKTDNTKTKN